MTQSALLRLVSTAATVIAILIFTGCDSTDTEELATCENLNGTYAATSASAEAINNPDLTETFSGASWSIAFSGNEFTSEFVTAADSAIEVSGTFEVTGESQQAPPQISFGGDPLLPDAQSGQQSFNCDYEGNGFALQTSEFEYDFGNDGSYEDAQFDAVFVEISE